jgi:hypothetical protein
MPPPPAPPKHSRVKASMQATTVHTDTHHRRHHHAGKGARILSYCLVGALAFAWTTWFILIACALPQSSDLPQHPAHECSTEHVPIRPP